MQRLHVLPRVLTLSGLLLVLASQAVGQECPDVPGTDWTYVNAMDNLIEATVALGDCSLTTYAKCQNADYYLNITSEILSNIFNYNMSFVGGARCLKDCELDRAIRLAITLADRNSVLQAKSGMYRRYDGNLEILRQWRDGPMCSTLAGIPPPGPGVAPPVPPVPGVAPPVPGVAPPAPTPSWRFAGSVLVSPQGGRNVWEGPNGTYDIITILDSGEIDRDKTKYHLDGRLETLQFWVDFVTPPPSGTIVAGTNYPVRLRGQVSGYLLPPGESAEVTNGGIQCIQGCTLRNVDTGAVSAGYGFSLNDVNTSFDLNLEIVPTAAPNREIKIQYGARAGGALAQMEWIYVPY